ncbi:MAG: nicotinate-nicotinamide nucleotide adenylyltransferase [Gaiella sp.]|nr:nicotinate-nicotinamide nucleotide adenylyltransferase [Gaiella sp.]
MAAVNIGVLGGAFDPPHVGHVALARAAIERFRLDRLLVRVVDDPGHKHVTTAPQIRLFLAELAFAPLDEVEVALDRFARTVDSLEALGLADPVFLVGADEFVDFPGWKEPERVLELARLGVASRPGFDRSELDAVLARLDRRERVTIFEIEPLPVSSSEIRARAAAGKPIDGLVPPAVAAEIARLRLYRAG